MELGEMLRAARKAAGIGLREMAERVNSTPAYLSMIEEGKRPALPEIVAAYERELGAAVMVSGRTDGELAALEWANRVSASDIGGDSLDRLEAAVDDLASAYTTQRPDELLAEVQRHLTYAKLMLDGKTTLTQHRRLVVAVGWLSLLAGTCHVDLGELEAARVRITVADSISEEAAHPVISAWCLETRAWQRLISGNFTGAAEGGPIVLTPGLGSGVNYRPVYGTDSNVCSVTHLRWCLRPPRRPIRPRNSGGVGFGLCGRSRFAGISWGRSLRPVAVLCSRLRSAGWYCRRPGRQRRWGWCWRRVGCRR
ncbi:helix-turn-helix domain-containing protein [Nocardia sp. NPDC088792]|uniref:helix-turn-helix domain-containing protein n=1 Tax=Nocardia sp. NPDC088792 TaxID=3364332 RepID=UPI00382098E5